MGFIKPTGSACVTVDGVHSMLYGGIYGLTPVDWSKLGDAIEWKKHPWSNQPDYISFEDEDIEIIEDFIEKECPKFCLITFKGTMTEYMRRKPASSYILGGDSD